MEELMELAGSSCNTIKPLAWAGQTQKCKGVKEGIAELGYYRW